MKILWFSNCVLGNGVCQGTGSWLYAMKDILSINSKLINITDSRVKQISYKSYGNFSEYILPKSLKVNGLPSLSIIKKIQNIINVENPDIIHIWGLENYWGLLFTRKYINKPFLLEIQGLLSVCKDVESGYIGSYYKCINYRFIDLIYHIYRLPKRLFSKSNYDEELLTHSKYISTQSQWTRDQIKFTVAEDSIIYEANRPLRKEFIISKKWEMHCSKYLNIYTTISYYAPFKGLHFLFLALSIIKKRYPNIILRISGVDITKKNKFLLTWYERYLLSLIKDYNLHKNISFLGRSNAQEIVANLLNCDVYINPSLIESYSASAAESLFLGVPTILAYSGALPNFSKKLPCALYYSPSDYRSLASLIINYSKFNNVEIIRRNAINHLSNKASVATIIEKQMNIYKDFYSRINNLTI